MLTDKEIDYLEQKIFALEQQTSAEFKIIVCKHAWFGLKRKARRLFQKYNLDRTTERNAVLILLVEKDREFLVYGDEGIHCKLGDGFWLNLKGDVISHFKKKEYSAGLSLAISLLADVLSDYFPANKDDVDEISNHIVFEN